MQIINVTIWFQLFLYFYFYILNTYIRLYVYSFQFIRCATSKTIIVIVNYKLARIDIIKIVEKILQI